MVRLAGFAVYVSGLLICAAMTSPARAAIGESQRLDDPARCPTVEAGKPINFERQTLVETPDLPPELRLLNSLVSANCLARAQQVQNKFLAEHPDDYRMSFINARLAWMFGKPDRAKAIANLILRQHPDFSSLLVLMASLAVDEKNYERAQTMLDTVYKLQPQDLWAYIDQLRLEADLTPSSVAFKRMRAIIRNPDFPPGVRITVYREARFMRGVTTEEDDKLFADVIKQPDAVTDCDLAQEAVSVLEIRKDPKKGAELIEESLKKTGKCAATAEIGVFLAEAYLLQAADIAPQPAEANQELVQKAKSVLNGDLTELARRTAIRTPLLNSLVPFFKGNVDSVGHDAWGRTTLCLAVVSNNADLAQEELENGANANGDCERRTLVGLLLSTPLDNKRVPGSQNVLRALLQHGAKFDSNDLQLCTDAPNGTCGQTLLPILQEFAKKGAATRASL